MVYIQDEGSVFNAPIEKILKFNHAESGHDHPSMKFVGMEEIDDRTSVMTVESTQGPKVTHKMRLTSFEPLGASMEFIEGPLEGSKSFQYYIPKGNKTGINVVGEYVSSMMSDEDIKKAVMHFLQTMFDEDQANLAKMK